MRFFNALNKLKSLGSSFVHNSFFFFFNAIKIIFPLFVGPECGCGCLQ